MPYPMGKMDLVFIKEPPKFKFSLTMKDPILLREVNIIAYGDTLEEALETVNKPTYKLIDYKTKDNQLDPET